MEGFLATSAGKYIFNFIVQIPFLFLILISAAVHELGHGYVAYKLGDNTAKEAGRLTLNPLKHIDLFGTIIFPIFLYIAHFYPIIMFKPVPVNPANFKDPKKDGMKTALAGPASNIALILVVALLLHILNLFPAIASSSAFRIIILFSIYLMMINLILAAFNLIPIPPLDGSWILRSFLPDKAEFYFRKYYTYFILAFILLAISGKLGLILRPLLGFFGSIIDLLIGQDLLQKLNQATNLPAPN